MQMCLQQQLDEKHKKSEYADLWLSLPYSMALSCGSFIAITYNFFSISINAVFVPSTASNGVTLSQM